jgi:hypothetical protein
MFFWDTWVEIRKNKQNFKVPEDLRNRTLVGFSKFHPPVRSKGMRNVAAFFLQAILSVDLGPAAADWPV